MEEGRRLGRAPTLERAPADGRVWPDRSLDVGLAASALGWAPAVAMADGLRGLVGMMAT
jgi:hypothetical protein